VSRMEHRGNVRTRIVPVAYDGFAPDAGAAVMAGEKQVGTFGSSAGGRALAMLRLDRVEDALATSQVLVAGAVMLRLVKLDWLRFALPGERKAG
jgi:tRNA-modifying protein YgfZ